jgi:hypothetical protein
MNQELFSLMETRPENPILFHGKVKTETTSSSNKKVYCEDHVKFITTKTTVEEITIPMKPFSVKAVKGFYIGRFPQEDVSDTMYRIIAMKGLRIVDGIIHLEGKTAGGDYYTIQILDVEYIVSK